MYASKPAQALIIGGGAAGTGTLAQTGTDVTAMLWLALTAVLIIMLGATVFWWTRTSPTQMTTGPKPVKARPRYRRKP